jgi:hypothetical protein
MDIRHYLFKHEMTVGAFAKLVGISAQNASLLKHKKHYPSVETMVNIILKTRGEIAPCDLLPELYVAYEKAKTLPQSTKQKRGRPSKKEVIK